MLGKLIDKAARELYRLFHPAVWGKKLQINGIPKITELHNLELGMNVSLNRDVYIQSKEKVTIENNVTLSKGVTLLTEGLDTNHYFDNAQKQFRDHIKKPIRIGEGTWVAAGVIICPGVEIAAYSIVAAGSVVVTSLTEENVLYGGCPAKKIKELT